MKATRLLTMLCLPAAILSANAIVPKTETTCHWMKVIDVERTDSSTRVGVRLQNHPNFWVRVSPDTRLMATEDTTLQYNLIATENIQTGSEIWMPESGQHDGVLIFEKVPDNIKVVDLVETVPSDIKNCTFGIHLEEPATPPVIPDLIQLPDILEKGPKPSEAWTGPDPERYADLNFYQKDGMAHIRGRITDYSPRYGVATFSIRTKDDFTEKENTIVGDINPDGTFSIDVPLTYPQYDYFHLGEIHRNLFLIPGDTLNITTSMTSRIDPARGFVPEFFGYEGEADDAVVINMLTESLEERYGLKSMYRKYKAENTDSMKADTYRLSDQLAALLDSVCEDLPDYLGNLPVSVFAKDMLSAAAIGRICERMEDIKMDYRYNKGARLVQNEDGTLSQTEGDPLDQTVFHKPWMKHQKLIYDNPLLVCCGWVLPNRWKFNDQFRPSAMAAEGMEEVPGTIVFISSDDITSIYDKDLNRLDSIGLGNCFAARLARISSLTNEFHTTASPSSESLDRYNRLVANAIKHNECGKLDEILLSEYNDFVKDVMIAENRFGDKQDASIVIPDSPEGNVLSKIIGPYKGNVLYLDFWGIGCGPCRAGMMDQKPLLEELADKPFKALYIANADEGLEACKKWLRKEEIKGEHIFVSGDDWQRLRGLFNFSGIPFGVLIDKDGKIVKAGFSIRMDDSLLRKTLEE
ncbi:MAG: TlpA family protein disulfide reductase [Muribaculaceae bacterium]|nr:TlpA family protein disulfide reductase [Muribaculaceae bacterium]